MTPVRIVPALDEVEERRAPQAGASGSAPVEQFDSTVAKKLSHRALS